MLYRHYHTVANDDNEAYQVQAGPATTAARLLALFGMTTIRRRYGGKHGLEAGTTGNAKKEPVQSSWRAPTRIQILWIMFTLVLIITMFTSAKNILCPDALHITRAQVSLPNPDQGRSGLQLTENITSGVLPVDCHSHNDYLQKRPLVEALENGCISVEADVWWRGSPIRGRQTTRLLIGHTERALKNDRTLENMYLDPLLELLNAKNVGLSPKSSHPRGVFDEDAKQTLILLIDFKTRGAETFTAVWRSLEPLRKKDYLSYHDGEQFHNGAVTVVATGFASLSSILFSAPERRDMFLDAPLDRLNKPVPVEGTVLREDISRLGKEDNRPQPSMPPDVDYDRSNSFYASASLSKVIGPFWLYTPSSSQRRKIVEVIHEAHKRNLVVRFWDTPIWPKARRDAIWKMLLEAGADVLNADDLPAAANVDYPGRVPGSPLIP